MGISVFIHCPNISYEPSKTWLSVQQPRSAALPGHAESRTHHQQAMHKRIYPPCYDRVVVAVVGVGRGEGISLESKHIATGRPLVCLSHCISQDCDHTPSGPNVCLVCAVITREAGDEEEEEEEEEEEGGNRVSTEGEGVFPLAGWVDDRQSRIILISRRDDSESERGTRGFVRQCALERR